MIRPQISILMAVYNAEPFLGEAIDSILMQTYLNWELICVNDGSTDHSLEILQALEQQDSRIKVLSQSNAGAANARNKALNISQGKYVCILDADDKLSNDYLEQTLSVALQHQENDCVIPEMYVWFWKNEAKSYSCNDIFRVPEFCDGMLALNLSIPWHIHALALWNGDMMREIGYRTEGYITSDEVSSRDFFAHCRRVVSSGGRYYYRYNEQSITKKISHRPIEKLMTNIQLRSLIEQYKLPIEEQIRINTYFFFELITWTMYFMRYKDLFNVEYQQQSVQIIKTAYKQRHISMVRPLTLVGTIKKILLGHNYAVYILICRTIYQLKGGRNGEQ